MRNSIAKAFLTTSEVASLLGVSIGTVQKMVDRKILDCYLTTGGHRRISAVSVKRYMSTMDPKLSQILIGESRLAQSGYEHPHREFVCLVDPFSAYADANLQNFQNFIFVSSPSELFRLYARRGVIVIDAAVTWVDWIDGLSKIHQEQEEISPDILVFNSQLIGKDRLKDIPEAAVLFDGDMAIDFIRGYFALQNRSPSADGFVSFS